MIPSPLQCRAAESIRLGATAPAAYSGRPKRLRTKERPDNECHHTEPALRNVASEMGA